eukprot:361754-Chlamydomonas_euryale.AAC.1
MTARLPARASGMRVCLPAFLAAPAAFAAGQTSRACWEQRPVWQPACRHHCVWLRLPAGHSARAPPGPLPVPHPPATPGLQPLSNHSSPL